MVGLWLIMPDSMIVLELNDMAMSAQQLAPYHHRPGHLPPCLAWADHVQSRCSPKTTPEKSLPTLLGTPISSLFFLSNFALSL